MTDNGSPYRAHALDAAVAGPRRPALADRPFLPDNGRAERVIQTLLREWAILTNPGRPAALPDVLYSRRRPHPRSAEITPGAVNIALGDPT